jgi:acyl-lipid omega-6 desaturase (Delta-12 desaturase)
MDNQQQNQNEITFCDKTAKEWARIVAKYKNPSHGRSILEIVVTCIPFVLLWSLAVYFYYHSYWLALLFMVPAAFLLVRLFAIQHDCGHGTLFRYKAVNDWIGRVLGVLTFTPYDVWKLDHAAHHSTSGNLSQRGYGDITTLTLEEYEQLGFWGKVSYRAYRHPLVLFIIGPSYLFILRQRVPLGRMKEFRAWLSAMATNIAIALIAVLLIYYLGFWAFMLVHLPIVILAGTIGVWLFYVQHQFEDTVWEREDNWDPQRAALFGSSHYDLPFILRWLTANIGAHHIHHLHSKIPYYRLPKIMRDHPQLKEVSRITLWQSFKCANLHLWDEANRRLISFRDRKGWK